MSQKVDYLSFSQQKDTSAQGCSDDLSIINLMMRAQSRIRTLEQDNQILRMHLELVNKENKQLETKLSKSVTQNFGLFEQIANLKAELKHYITLIHSWKLNKDLFDSFFIQQTANKQNILGRFPQQQDKTCDTQYFNQESMRLLKKQVLDQAFLPFERLKRNKSCFDMVGSPIQREKQQKSIARIESVSIKEKQKNGSQIQHYDRFESPQKKKSPLIRKNNRSNSIEKVGLIESSSELSQFQRGRQTNIKQSTKKFNYSNWRKANNNLTVWERGQNLKQGRYPLTLN